MEAQVSTAIAPRVKKSCGALSAAKSLSTSSGNAEEDRSDALLYSPMATHMGPLCGEPQAANLAQRSRPPEVLLQVSYHLSDRSLAAATEREPQMARLSGGNRVRALVRRTGWYEVGEKTKGTRKQMAKGERQ